MKTALQSEMCDQPYEPFRDRQLERGMVSAPGQLQPLLLGPDMGPQLCERAWEPFTDAMLRLAVRGGCCWL